MGRLLDTIPGPVTLDPDRWDQDPLIHSICISAQRTGELIASSAALQRFSKTSKAPVVFALLTAEKREKVVSGTETNGEIVRRDVLQKAVFFDNHQIGSPGETLEESRRLVQQMLLSGLFAQAAEKIAALKGWKSELETQHDEVTAKMGLFRRGSRRSEIEGLHDAIEEKIEEIEAALDSPEDYVAPLMDLLRNPERFLSAKRISLKLNPMGILLGDASREKAGEFFLAAFEFEAGQKWAATWIRVQRDVILNL
jgi:hypothetical protein